MTMYNAIINVAQHVMINYAADVQKLIPSGSAIQNIRGVVGDYLTRDGYHLNEYYGRLTAGLTWFKAITGAKFEGMENNAGLLKICNEGLSGLTANGVNITAQELLNYCIAAAEAAVKNPFVVAEIE